ncbi:CHAT domain-containing protein [Maioricimonas sp. JC845]|uniref:CHAT domain-containing protein n=1 Tax=Maioricimonas sp. JC845 TaxID=3232138 RepID=UPI003458BC48
MALGLATFVTLLAAHVAEGGNNAPILLQLNENGRPVLNEVTGRSVAFEDHQLRMVVWTDGRQDRWTFFTRSWQQSSGDSISRSASSASDPSRGSALHVATDLYTLQAMTTALPQLRSGTVTRDTGGLLTPYNGAILASPKITIRRLPSEDDAGLQSATATLRRDGESLVQVSIPAEATQVQWGEIADLPSSLADGLSPGRYELELKPTPAGVQRVSFEIADASVHGRLVRHAIAVRELLGDTSPLPTQLAVEEFLRQRPPMLADALDWLDAFPADNYTQHLKRMKRHVSRRLQDVGQHPRARRAAGPSTGDAQIDAVRNLIAAHDWQAALGDLELIQEDSDPQDVRRQLLIHLYRGVIHSESGASGDADARVEFDQAVQLLDQPRTTPEDQFRVHFNYANHLIGRATDRLHNHAFQMAAGVRHPITTSLQEWMAAHEQLSDANDSATTEEDKAAVRLNSARLWLLLADIVSSLAEAPDQAELLLAGIQSQAESDLNELTGEAAELNGPHVSAIATEMQALLSFRRGNTAAANEAAQSARQQFTELGDLVGIEGVERLLGLIAMTETHDNAKADALRHFQVSEQLSDLLRDRYLKDASGQSIAGFMGRRYYVNEQIVDLLASQGHAKEALEYAERAKARAFSDLLLASGKVPQSGHVFSVGPSTANWPHGIVVLEYFFTADNCWLFVVSADGNVNVERLATATGHAIAPQQLIERVAHAREMLNNYKFQWQDEAFGRHFDDAWQHQLHELYKILIPDEISERLAKSQRVVIVPHHILHYFPFAALVTDVDTNADRSHMALPHFLLDQPFAISYTPSLATWRLLNGNGPLPIRRVGIVADTRPTSGLREVATEVNAIRQAFGDRVFAIHDGEEATTPNATAVLKAADLAFFGCHGQNVWDAPLDGHLLLSDGNLSARTLLNAEVNAAIVILSACHSGLADRSPLPGDDLFGLERVLLSRGSQCVVSGNWLVDDLRGARITSALTTSIAKGLPADLALADAQRSVLERYRSSTDERLRFFSHPHFWAVYKVSGAFAGEGEQSTDSSQRNATGAEDAVDEVVQQRTESMTSAGRASATNTSISQGTHTESVLIRNVTSGYEVYFAVDGNRFRLSSGASRWIKVREGQSNLTILGGKRTGSNSRQPPAGGGFTTALGGGHVYDLVRRPAGLPVFGTAAFNSRGPGFVARDRGKGPTEGPTEGPNDCRVWIQNPYGYAISYELNGERFTVKSRHTRWHTSNAATGFTVEYDWSFEKGYQRKAFRLFSGSRNYFVETNNGLDLLRRARQEGISPIENARSR